MFKTEFKALFHLPNIYFYILDGFSKRISDADHTSNHGTSCEYAHPYFMKEHPCLLLSIKQKRGEKVVSLIR